MPHRIAHNYRPEIYLPWSAIEGNIDLILGKSDNLVEMQDGIICAIKRHREIHVLSESDEWREGGKNLIKRLYDIPVITFLETWYKKLQPYGFDSTRFVWMELEEVKKEDAK